VRLRRFIPAPNPIAVARDWNRFQDLYGASAAAAVAFASLSVLVRWTEVAGRLYYYWTHARHQRSDRRALSSADGPR
jgi:hypothetical protein